ncbi:MAG: formate dehydrogenase accessory sulfurtransferase FdhD [Candidatus Cloacimonetes bacterium]|nr:formate dehydrogenase accessory sulfurtransferase FdhD [Candidatus Cloacimonadota bacterium]
MDEIRALKEIKKYQNGKFEMLTDIVVREISFTININNRRLTAIACLPDSLLELALGFLFSEGLILSSAELLESEFTPGGNEINFKLEIPLERIQSFFLTGEKTSGCGSSLSSALTGSNSAFPHIKIDAEAILQQMRRFQQDSALFKQTGGVHSAGLVKDDEIEYYAEDIGRHNAVDKVIGRAILNQSDLQSYYLICSGRISSEIVKKCVRMHIPLIVSQSAATSEAIRLGWKYKTFIIGFTRGNRFNLYTGIEEEIFVKSDG